MFPFPVQPKRGQVPMWDGTRFVPATPAAPSTAVGIPAGGATGQVLAKVDATDYNVAWTTPTGGSGYDDWQNVHGILTMLTAQVSAARMGFSDGWIDSLLDTSGVTLANCVGVFSAGSATGTTASLATADMTSNTTPSGVCSAKTAFDTSYAAWKAFNQSNVDSSDAWLTDVIPIIGSSSSWQWLRYDFGASSAPIIATYDITTRNYVDATHPKTWILQGSNDATNWTDLHSVSNETWTYNQTKSYTCTTTGAYRYYQLLIKECTGPTYLAVGELKLYIATAALVMESTAVTCPNTATEFMVDMSVSTNAVFTVQVDTGNGSGWQTVTMTRVAASATVDQLTGKITTTAGTSAKVKVTADTSARVCYGWSLFWR